MPKNADNALDRFFRFLVFGGIGTAAGMACVSLSRSLLFHGVPAPISVFPTLGYLALIVAVTRLRFQRGDRVGHGVMLLCGTGLLAAVPPYYMLAAATSAYRGLPAAVCLYMSVMLATLTAILWRWLRLYLSGQESAAGRGVTLLLAAFLAFLLLAVPLLVGH